jgi:hypothetical protein
LPAAHRHASNSSMAEVKKIGRHTHERLTDEEALAKYDEAR